MMKPSQVQEQLCAGMDMTKLTRNESLAEETSGVVFLPTEKQNIYLPRWMKKNDSGSFASP